MSSIKYLRLRTVLDFAHVNASQNSRTYKLQKKRIQDLKNLTNRERPLTDQTTILQVFKSGPTARETFRV